MIVTSLLQHLVLDNKSWRSQEWFAKVMIISIQNLPRCILWSNILKDIYDVVQGVPKKIIFKLIFEFLSFGGVFLDAVASLALGHDCRSHLNCENINELSVLKVENTNGNTNERIIEQDY